MCAARVNVVVPCVCVCVCACMCIDIRSGPRLKKLPYCTRDVTSAYMYIVSHDATFKLPRPEEFADHERFTCTIKAV